MTARFVRPQPGHAWRPVLFDMDGTLIDSAPAIMGRISETLTHYGIDVPPESEMIHFIGPPTLSTLTRFIPADNVAEAALFYRSLSERDGLSRQSLFSGIPDLLDRLSSTGIPLGIASSKPQDEVERIASHFDIAQYFQSIVGSAHDRTDKSHVVSSALRDLQRTATSPALMVGDRVWDIEGAAAHDVPTILVSWGYAERGEEATAIAVAHSLADLSSFVLGGRA